MSYNFVSAGSHREDYTMCHLFDVPRAQALSTSTPNQKYRMWCGESVAKFQHLFKFLIINRTPTNLANFVV